MNYPGIVAERVSVSTHDIRRSETLTRSATLADVTNNVIQDP